MSLFYSTKYITKTLFVIFIPVLLNISNVFADSSINQLNRSIDRILSKYTIPKDSLSLYIREVTSPQPLIALNIDTPRTPASVIKILTTFAGLELLGPDYTWETHIHLDGKIENETLNGNLIIEGGGDPFLVSETFWHILFTLRSRGLKHINGDLLIDDELFEDETGSPGDFDNRPYRAYNMFPDAALLNFRVHEFHFIPMKNRVHIYADPPASNLQIRNKLKLVHGKCRGKHLNINFNVFTQGSVTTVEFSGDYPASCGPYNMLRAVMTNDDYIYGVFRSLWESMGGTINGNFGKTSIDSKKPFYVVKSKPLSEIITYINKYSNNVMARQLLLTIGQETLGTTGSKTSGRKAIADWLFGIGIEAPKLILDNGSGLSRNTRVSARTLGMLLEHAYNSPYQPEFFASLPIVGVDGTVKKRLEGKIAPGNGRIKTGLINNVRAMAGYIKSINNKNYIVVSLQNFPGVQNTIGTLIQDEIIKWLYNQ